MAGYRGSTDTATSRTIKTSILFVTVTVPATTLKIQVATTGSDKVTVSYYEDRFDTATTPLAVQFSADASNQTLYRYKAGDAAKQPVAEDVRSFKVLRYIRKDGKECNSVTPNVFTTAGEPGTLTTSGNLAGLRLELTFSANVKKQIVIPLANTQTSSATDLPTLTTPSNPAGC